MGGRNQNKYNARFLYKDELMAFNRREKHIIPLVDCDEDDPMDDQRSQGAWNKAINGKPSPEELVEELEGLYASQRDNPKKYLPEAPPEDLIPWMTEIATREWWAEALDVDKNQLIGWFTGRSKKLDGIVQQKVADWYNRLRDAMTETSTLTKLGRISVEKSQLLEYGLRLIEDGDEITDDLLKKMVWAWFISPEIIDWANPKSGYPDMDFDESSSMHERCFKNARKWIDETQTKNWKGVRSSLPPDDMWEKLGGVERMWGCEGNDPHGLNKQLYDKSYKATFRLVWDRDARDYRMIDHRIVSVLADGEWRSPTEREKVGWDEGTKFFWAELRAEQDGTVNYTR